MKLFFLALSCLCSSLAACAQKASKATDAVYQFGAAFHHKQADKILPLLSDSFSIGIYQGRMADHLVKGIVKKYYALDSLQVTGMDKNATGSRVSVRYFFHDRDPFISSVALDNDDKIVYTRLFDGLYRVNRNAEVHRMAEIPFRLVNGSIVVDLRLNHSPRVLHILFDTGADGMGLSREAADSVGLQVSYEKKAAVVGTNTRVQISADNTIHIDTLAIPGQNIAIFPKIDGGLDGLFGGNLIRRYITRVDFDRQVIELYNFGHFEYKGKGSALPVDFSSGVPEIQADISLGRGKKISGKFNFDTGAGYNLIIFGPLAHRDSLWHHFQAEYYSENHSLGHTSRIMTGDVRKITLGDYALYHFPASIQQYRPGDEQWTQSGGSVGIHLLRKFNFTIDLLDKVIYLEPNQMFDRPFDFVLGGLFLGFGSGNDLVVKGVVPGSRAAQSGIMAGDEVVSINSMPGAMLREPDAQTHVRESGDSNYVVEIQRGDHTRNVDLPVRPVEGSGQESL